MFLDVWTVVVLVDGLTEAFALFRLLSHEGGDWGSGKRIERNWLVFRVPHLL